MSRGHSVSDVTPQTTLKNQQEMQGGQPDRQATDVPDEKDIETTMLKNELAKLKSKYEGGQAKEKMPTNVTFRHLMMSLARAKRVINHLEQKIETQEKTI